MQITAYHPENQNPFPPATHNNLPARADNLASVIDTIVHIERVYARPGPVWRMVGDVSEDSGRPVAISNLRKYLIERGVPQEYWINYRQTTRGDFIENARVIPFEHLSALTQDRYRELAGTLRGAVITVGEEIAGQEVALGDKRFGELVRVCLDEIAETLGRFDHAIQRSLIVDNQDKTKPERSPLLDQFCRYRAVKLFGVIAREQGIFDNNLAESAFRSAHDDVVDARFSGNKDTPLPELFAELVRQHGERPTPFLRNDPDLYDFFRERMPNLGPLPSDSFTKNISSWCDALLRNISPLLADQVHTSNSAVPVTIGRPETQSGTRSFVGIIRDSEQTPLAIIKIGSGPDRLEEILSEAMLDTGDMRTVLPFSWGRFGDETFFALYPIAGDRDEDQRFAERTAEPQARVTFSSQLGEIIADYHLSSNEYEDEARPPLSRYRDIAQRVYNLTYDIKVLDRRLQSAPTSLSEKVGRIISAYRQALVFEPSTFASGAVHGDLYPSNLFVEGDDYRIIDNNQGAYYRGRVMSTGDPAKDVGQSIGYLLVQWARRHGGGDDTDLSRQGDSSEDLITQVNSLISSYLKTREQRESPVPDKIRFIIGGAFHACCFAAKNWCDTEGVKFRTLKSDPPSDSMRHALFGALDSFLDHVKIPPSLHRPHNLTRFWDPPREYHRKDDS